MHDRNVIQHDLCIMALLPVLYIPTIEREKEKKYDDHTQSSQSSFYIEGQGICKIPQDL